MPKAIETTGLEQNRNTSDSSDGGLPIRQIESEAFAGRLKEISQGESNRSFAKRCGMSDALFGAYLRGEKTPGMDRLVAMANAGSVTVDWLATGRLPKTRSSLIALDEAHYAAAVPGAVLKKDELRKQYGATVALSAQPQKSSDRASVEPVSAALMSLCHGACGDVFGERFKAEEIDVQVRYATNLYNMLLLMAAACRGSAEKGVRDLTKLGASGMAEQLRLLVKLGWVSDYFPPAPGMKRVTF